MSHNSAVRATALAGCLFLFSCSDEKPDGGVPDGGASQDADDRDAATLPDAIPLRPDAELVVPHDGGGPASCTFSCDCPQGYACVNSSCTLLGNPVYCCEKGGCPSGQACLDDNDRPEMCPSPPDAGPDAGAPDLGAGYVGAFCEVDSDCTQVPGMSCWTRDEPPFVWGYCTIEGCVSDLECPMNSRCLAFNLNPGQISGCLQTCTGEQDCRSDAYCLPIPTLGISICLPDCRDDLFDCAPRDGTTWCNRMSGQCEALSMQDPNAQVGDACISNADCGSGDVCMGEFAFNFTDGLCTHVCSGLPESTPCSVNETCQDFLGIGLCFANCVGASCPNRANSVCTTLDPNWVVNSCVPQ